MDGRAGNSAQDRNHLNKFVLETLKNQSSNQEQQLNCMSMIATDQQNQQISMEQMQNHISLPRSNIASAMNPNMLMADPNTLHLFQQQMQIQRQRYAQMKYMQAQNQLVQGQGFPQQNSVPAVPGATMSMNPSVLISHLSGNDMSSLTANISGPNATPEQQQQYLMIKRLQKQLHESAKAQGKTLTRAECDELITRKFLKAKQYRDDQLLNEQQLRNSAVSGQAQAQNQFMQFNGLGSERSVYQASPNAHNLHQGMNSNGLQQHHQLFAQKFAQANSNNRSTLNTSGGNKNKTDLNGQGVASTGVVFMPSSSSFADSAPNYSQSSVSQLGSFTAQFHHLQQQQQHLVSNANISQKISRSINDSNIGGNTANQYMEKCTDAISQGYVTKELPDDNRFDSIPRFENDEDLESEVLTLGSFGFSKQEINALMRENSGSGSKTITDNSFDNNGSSKLQTYKPSIAAKKSGVGKKRGGPGKTNQSIQPPKTSMGFKGLSPSTIQIQTQQILKPELDMPSISQNMVTGNYNPTFPHDALDVFNDIMPLKEQQSLHPLGMDYQQKLKRSISKRLESGGHNSWPSEVDIGEDMLMRKRSRGQNTKHVGQSYPSNPVEGAVQMSSSGRVVRAPRRDYDDMESIPLTSQVTMSPSPRIIIKPKQEPISGKEHPIVGRTLSQTSLHIQRHNSRTKIESFAISPPSLGDLLGGECYVESWLPLVKTAPLPKFSPYSPDSITIDVDPNKFICHIPRITIKNVEILNDTNFQGSVLSQPITIISNMLSTVGLEGGIFSLDRICREHGKSDMEGVYLPMEVWGKWGAEPLFRKRMTVQRYMSYMRQFKSALLLAMEQEKEEITKISESAVNCSSHVEDLRGEDIDSATARAVEESCRVPCCWPRMLWQDYLLINSQFNPTLSSCRRARHVAACAAAAHALRRDSPMSCEIKEESWLDLSADITLSNIFPKSVQLFVHEDLNYVQVFLPSSNDTNTANPAEDVTNSSPPRCTPYITSLLLFGPYESKSYAERAVNAMSEEPLQVILATLPKCLVSFYHPCRSPNYQNPAYRTMSFSNINKNQKKRVYKKPLNMMGKDAYPDSVRFCMGLDITTWEEQDKALRDKIPKWLQCNSEYDILQAMRLGVSGINTPQVYIKAPGVWIGGCESNCRFRIANCNHGPGSVEWGSIESIHAAKLRQLAMDEFGVDIYAAEGKWYPDPEWLRYKRIPAMYGIQKPGDTILIKGDTLHWARSLGFIVCTTWNFAHLEAHQLVTSLERDAINRGLSPPKKSLVPMQTLSIDIAVHLINSFTQEELQRIDRNVWSVLARSLETALKDETINASELVNFGLVSQDEPGGSCTLNCESPLCNGEIVLHYVRCSTCDAKNGWCTYSSPIEGSQREGTSVSSGCTLKPVLLCISCAKKHKKLPFGSTHDLRAFYRKSYSLKQLRDVTSRIRELASTNQQNHHTNTKNLGNGLVPVFNPGGANFPRYQSTLSTFSEGGNSEIESSSMVNLIQQSLDSIADSARLFINVLEENITGTIKVEQLEIAQIGIRSAEQQLCKLLLIAEDRHNTLGTNLD